MEVWDLPTRRPLVVLRAHHEGTHSVALTPDGSELWVGGLTSDIVTVFNTSNDTPVGTFNVGFGGANSGDGDEPTGIVLTSTPTPGG